MVTRARTLIQEGCKQFITTYDLRDEIEFRFIRRSPDLVYLETWFGLNIDFWFKDVEGIRTIFAADIYLPLVYRNMTKGWVLKILMWIETIPRTRTR